MAASQLRLVARALAALTLARLLGGSAQTTVAPVGGTYPPTTVAAWMLTAVPPPGPTTAPPVAPTTTAVPAAPASPTSTLAPAAPVTAAPPTGALPDSPTSAMPPPVPGATQPCSASVLRATVTASAAQSVANAFFWVRTSSAGAKAGCTTAEAEMGITMTCPVPICIVDYRLQLAGMLLGQDVEWTIEGSNTQGGTTSWQQLASGGPRLEYEMPEAGAPPGPFPTYPVESCDASSACQSSSDDVWMAFKPAGLLHTSLIDAVSLSYTAIPFHPIQREEVRRAVAIAYDVNAEQVQLNAFSQTAPDSYNRSDATASFNIWSYAELPSFGEAMSEQSQQYAQESVVLASSYVAADNQRIQGRGREIAQSHHHDLGNALVQVCPPSSKLHNAPTGDVKISSVQQGAEAATFPPTVVPMAAAPQVPIQVATSPPADIAVGPALQIVGTAEVVAASQEDRAKLTNAQGQGVLQAALASIAAVPQDAVTLEALSLGGTSASLQARRLQLASGSAPLTMKFAVTAANPSQARRLQLASGSAPLTVKFAVTAANPSQGDDIQQALLKVAHANTAMSPDASQLLGTLNTMTQPGSQYPLAATLPSANIVPGYTYARVWTPDTPKPTVPPPAPAPPMPAAAPAAVPEHMYHKATAGDANSSSISVWWWVLGLAVLLALGALAAFAYFRSKKSKRGVQKSREVGGSISRDAESGARAHDYEAAGSEAMDSAAPALLAAEATAPLHAAMGSEAPRAAVPPSGNDEPWIFPSTAPHGLHGQAANVFATNAAAASSFGSRPLLQMAQQSMAQLQTRASQAAPDFASFQRSQAYAAVPAAPQFQFQPQPLASSYFQNSMRLH